MARASVVETEKERQRANAAQQRRVSMAALKQSQQQQHQQQLQQPSALASPTTSTRQASTPLPPSRRRPVNPLNISSGNGEVVDDANVDASPLSALQTSPLRARARAISRRSAAPMPTPITADFVAELAASQEALPSNLLSLVTVSEFISFSRMTEYFINIMLLFNHYI